MNEELNQALDVLFELFYSDFDDLVGEHFASLDSRVTMPFAYFLKENNYNVE